MLSMLEKHFHMFLWAFYALGLKYAQIPTYICLILPLFNVLNNLDRRRTLVISFLATVWGTCLGFTPLSSEANRFSYELR
jgi:hypothetical protein